MTPSTTTMTLGRQNKLGLDFASHFGSLAREVGLVALGVAVLMVIVALCLHKREVSARVGRPGMLGVIGPMGSGKTYLMAHLANEALRDGRQVYANFHLVGASLLTGWSDIAENVAPEGCEPVIVYKIPDRALVLLAELQLWWPADIKFGPDGIEEWCHQLRHHDQTCVWDSQDWTFPNGRFRKLTQEVVEAQPAVRGTHIYTVYNGHRYNPVRRSEKANTGRVVLKRSPVVEAMYNTKEDVRHHMHWAEGRATRLRRRAVGPR